MWRKTIEEFCAQTGLHGYNLIVHPKRMLLERSIWGIIVVTSMTVAITMSTLAWFDSMQSYVSIVTDSTTYSIWYYNFPAITICNFNQVSRIRAENFAKKLKSNFEVSTEDVIMQLRYLVQLFPTTINDVPQFNMTTLQDLLDFNNITAHEALRRVTPKCEYMIQLCWWKGLEQMCDTLFEQIITDTGYCCSFNYYALKNHRFGGSMSRKFANVPRKLAACGYSSALEVLLEYDAENYMVSSIPSYGFTVIIHDSYDIPDFNADHILLSDKTTTFFGLSPTITNYTPAILNLGVNYRKCFFHGDRSLHSTTRYSYTNCMVECRMSLIRRYCACIPFYYHSGNATLDDARFCNLRDYPCLRKYFKNYMSSIPGTFHSKRTIHEDEQCDCPPTCQYTQYLIENSKATFSTSYISSERSDYGGITLRNQTFLRVFFNDLIGVKNIYVVNYPWQYMFAQIGGIMGFFTGFSFLSGLEIIYFFTIRLFVSFYKEKKTSKMHEKQRLFVYSRKL